MGQNKTKVLFVCLGNICRSPMAEALFNSKVSERGLGDHFLVDSAGTGDWHVGQKADPRTIETCRENNIPVISIARQLQPGDFEEFDHVIVMDSSNYDNAARLSNGQSSKISLMRKYDHSGSGKDVPDPYFGGDDGFEKVFRLLDESTENLLNELTGGPGL